MFAVEDDGDLTPINKVDIDGMRGCYLSVDKTGRYLFVAGYHDGKVTVVHTHKDGRLGSLMDGVFHKGLAVWQSVTSARMSAVSFLHRTTNMSAQSITALTDQNVQAEHTA